VSSKKDGPGARRYLPDVVDGHIYGGAALMAVGAGTFHVGAGLLVAGLTLLVIVGLPLWMERRP